VRIPAQIDRHLAGWDAALVWESGTATLTWLMTGPGGEQRYLKTAPADAAVPLRAEAARMRWAGAAGLPVPLVVAACGAGPAEWLLTRDLAGRSAVDPGLPAARSA
jgi:aminoglycoside phosphotransferase